MVRKISTRFRRISHPNSLMHIIERETARIQRRHPKINGFQIIVDKPTGRCQTRDQVRAQIIVSVPQKKICVSKEAQGMTESHNAVVALNTAIDAMAHAVDQYLKRG